VNDRLRRVPAGHGRIVVRQELPRSRPSTDVIRRSARTRRSRWRLPAPSPAIAEYGPHWGPSPRPPWPQVV